MTACWPVPNSDAGGKAEVDHLFTGALARWTHLSKSFGLMQSVKNDLEAGAGDFATSINVGSTPILRLLFPAYAR